jgi:prepilin-type N-terminal cleavage/methylation domain-containing protein
MIHAPRYQNFPRRGFTLLELVVAMSLGLVLLSAIWAMFSLFTQRVESDRLQTEKSQLLRAVHQLLSRDLNNVVPEEGESISRATLGNAIASSLRGVVPPITLPITGEPSDDSASAAKASLVGTSSELQLLIFDSAPPSDIPSEDQTAKRTFFSPPPSIDWPYRRVIYRWQTNRVPSKRLAKADDDATSGDKVSGPPGLTRRESYFASNSPSRDDDASGPAPNHSNNALAPRSRLFASTKPSDLEPSEQIISEETVGEFAEMMFEYFDGVQWRDGWDSRETGTLPMAIRIRFDLDVPIADQLQASADRLDPEFESTQPAARPSSTDSLEEASLFDYELVLSVSHDSQPNQDATAPQAADAETTE